MIAINDSATTSGSCVFSQGVAIAAEGRQPTAVLSAGESRRHTVCSNSGPSSRDLNVVQAAAPAMPAMTAAKPPGTSMVGSNDDHNAACQVHSASFGILRPFTNMLDAGVDHG